MGRLRVEKKKKPIMLYREKEKLDVHFQMQFYGVLQAPQRKG